MWNKEGLQEFRFRNRLMVGGEMGWWWGHSDQLVPPRPGANFQTDPPFPVIALAHLNISPVLGNDRKPSPFPRNQNLAPETRKRWPFVCEWETLLLLWEGVTWGFARLLLFAHFGRPGLGSLDQPISFRFPGKTVFLQNTFSCIPLVLCWIQEDFNH